MIIAEFQDMLQEPTLHFEHFQLQSNMLAIGYLQLRLVSQYEFRCALT